MSNTAILMVIVAVGGCWFEQRRNSRWERTAAGAASNKTAQQAIDAALLNMLQTGKPFADTDAIELANETCQPVENVFEALDRLHDIIDRVSVETGVYMAGLGGGTQPE